MDRNPYSPPAAVLRDQTPPGNRPPNAVTRAEVLVWVSLVSSFLRFTVSPAKAASLASWVGALVGTVVAISLMVGVVKLLTRGARWIRVVLLLCVTLAILAWQAQQHLIVLSYDTYPVTTAVSVGQIAVWLSALCLLSTPSARRWASTQGAWPPRGFS